MNNTNKGALLEIKNKVLNVALVACASIGFVAHTVAIAVDWGEALSLTFYIQTCALLMLITLAIYRKKLSFGLKVYILIFVVFIAIAAGLYSFGILASSSVFIVALPIFASFNLSIKKSFILWLFLILMYVTFGILFLEGVLVYPFDMSEYLENSSLWLVERIVDLVLASIGLLFIGHYFTQALINNQEEIEAQKNQLLLHKEQLEELVKERTRELELANKELSLQSKQIKDQNRELQSIIEHLKETQTQLVQSEKMASLGVLTAGVAHEINNPLNFIHSGVNGLENQLNNPEIANKKDTVFFINTIKTGIKRVVSIVKSLGQFSRSNVAQDEVCDIHNIIENCLVMLQHKHKGLIRIEKDYTKELVEVMGNDGKLHQVFLNILSNAIQAIEQEGLIEINSSIENDKVVVRIKDNGCGISDEYISKITDPFFTTKRPGEGTGLGLSITVKIVVEHKGLLEFQSEENKGTTAIISLPLQAEPAQELKATN
ncbi:ATP-binding protein [Flammeovirgaceae bacterium SG7u.111]|nr:ATP-binding protein [Flammeovirgaceae bacterium SG7u.132]WPO38366.1 ATP-binding protein [Flammeovirgaceae bacterium SG7u.111]